jgi:hypothetical protein
MERFVKRYEDRISGIISGFDRILFSGTLPSIRHTRMMDIWLSSRGVLYKDFGSFAQELSEQVKAHAEAVAVKAGRELIYLNSSRESKEDVAKQIMHRDGIAEGLICVLSCVEPCKSYRIGKDPQKKKLTLLMQERKCLHYYFYYVDREFGFMHVRLQSWLPFTIQVYINGREYLARQMDKAGIKYEKADNCFSWIENLEKAQVLINKLGERKWVRLLNALARRVNPLIGKAQLSLRKYYWSVRECEYATDIMFRDAKSLAEIYPSLTRYAIEQLGSESVLRFLQRRINCRFSGEVKSDMRKRVEGVRVKHWVEENSIKMYDKQGSVLRVETTINNARRFKVFRQGKRKGKIGLYWIPMRKGVVDMRRMVEVSVSANKRYLEALAEVGDPTSSIRLLDSVSKPVKKQQRTYRPLHPVSPEDAKLLSVIVPGEFLIQGLRNKDLRKRLAADSERNPEKRRLASARITRLLRLLRAHGLIYKVAKTNFYRITKKGHQVMTTAVKFRLSNIALLAA